VDVDEARRQNLAARVDLDIGAAVDLTDLGDAVAAHRDVALEHRRAGAIGDQRIPHNEGWGRHQIPPGLCGMATFFAQPVAA